MRESSRSLLRRASSRRLPNDQNAVFCLFILALATHRVEIGEVFTLTYGEGLLVLIAPLAWRLRHRVDWHSARGVFMVLVVAWLASQVLTDIVRQTPSHDYLRGWARIFMTGLTFFVASVVLGNSWSRYRTALFAVLLSGAFYVLLSPTGHAVGNTWKFGIGIPLSIVLVLLATLRARTAASEFRRAAVALALLVPVHILYGFRSAAGACLLALLISLLAISKGRFVPGPLINHAPIRPTPRRRFVSRMKAVVVVGVFIPLILSSYEWSAREGLLGSNAQQRYYYSYSEAPFLLRDRAELYVSLSAIRSSPWLGHGSWAKDVGYALRYLEIRGIPSARLHSTSLSGGIIPTHSHLFGSWVEGGIAGAIFWVGALCLCLAAVMIAVGSGNVPTGAGAPVVVVSVILGWDIVFSPYGGERRVIVPLFLAFLVFTWEHSRALRSGSSS